MLGLGLGSWLSVEEKYLEERAKHGAVESSALDYSLLSVHAVGDTAAKESLEVVANRDDTHSGADPLNVVELLLGHVGASHGLSNGGPDAVENAHVLQQIDVLIAGELVREVLVIHEALNAEASRGVLVQVLLDTLNRGQEAEPGALVALHVDLVLVTKVLGEALSDGEIELIASELGLVGGGEDGGLGMGELHNGGAKVGGTHAEEEDLLGASGEVGAVETPGEGSSREVIDETDNVHASNLSRVNHAAALTGGPETGDSDANIGHRDSGGGLTGLLEIGEEHGGDLLSGEGPLLALEGDLSGNATLSSLDKLGARERGELSLHGRVLKRTAKELAGPEDRILHISEGLVTTKLEMKKERVKRKALRKQK